MKSREQMKQIDRAIWQTTALYSEWSRMQGLTYNTLLVLCAIDRFGTPIQKQIAEGYSLPKQTVNSIVKELEHRGWVHTQTGAVGRERPLAFTEEGHVQAGVILERMYQLEDRVMERMGPALCQSMLEGELAFAAALAEEVRHGA